MREGENIKYKQTDNMNNLNETIFNFSLGLIFLECDPYFCTHRVIAAICPKQVVLFFVRNSEGTFI